MKLKTKFILATLILAIISSNTALSARALEIERHSNLLRSIVYNEIYSYESFIKWLNEMELMNIDNFQNPLGNISMLMDERTARDVLNKVYNDSKIAMFVGGVQLRMLKKYAGLKPFINESDIANLIIAAVKGSNVTLTSAYCNNVLSKFIVYIARLPNGKSKELACKWNINDLELYAIHILSLDSHRLNTTVVKGILGYLYILRNAAINGNIDRSLLNSILEDVSTRYSLVTALFMKVFINNYNMNIIDRELNNKRVENYALTIPTIYMVNESRDVDLAEILVKAILLIEKLRGEGIDVEDINVFKLIDILMNINVEEYHNIMSNINEIVNDIDGDINEGLRLRVKVNISYSYYNDIYIDDQMYYYVESWRDYESTEASSQYYHFETTLTDIGGALNLDDSRAIDSQSLAKLLERDFVKEIIEYSNKPTVEIIGTRIIHTLPTINTRYSVNRVILSGELNMLVFVVLLVAIGTFLFVVIINAKIKPLLKQLIYIPRDLSRSKIMQSKSDSVKTRIFAEFWNTMYRFANELNLKIENSYTHREISRKITAVLSISIVRLLLERITYLYEVLRYSNEGDDELLEELREKLSIAAHSLNKQSSK
ncbi:MAG: hypothetical protein N3E36_07250 [Sulfolobales archaeon]|nr:hypothetical protein [Ignisphaera sp.]MCX8199787.1 hypothetical protein [Sulfolobales archaeon]MDW8084974.1 hypothetical protein [Ignisphaera sp.]